MAWSGHQLSLRSDRAERFLFDRSVGVGSRLEESFSGNGNTTEAGETLNGNRQHNPITQTNLGGGREDGEMGHSADLGVLNVHHYLLQLLRENV